MSIFSDGRIRPAETSDAVEEAIAAHWTKTSESVMEMPGNGRWWALVGRLPDNMTISTLTVKPEKLNALLPAIPAKGQVTDHTHLPGNHSRNDHLVLQDHCPTGHSTAG